MRRFSVQFERLSGIGDVLAEPGGRQRLAKALTAADEMMQGLQGEERLTGVLAAAILLGNLIGKAPKGPESRRRLTARAGTVIGSTSAFFALNLDPKEGA